MRGYCSVSRDPTLEEGYGYEREGKSLTFSMSTFAALGPFEPPERGPKSPSRTSRSMPRLPPPRLSPPRSSEEIRIREDLLCF